MRVKVDGVAEATRHFRSDPIAATFFALGTLLLLVISRLNFRGTEANWDLLNYHAYVPASLLDGTWFSNFHPAGTQSYLTPYQDLLWWPLISSLPAPIATTLIVAVQVSIFVPLGLIVRIVVPTLSAPRALGLGLIGSSGAMVATELGGTNGDVLPAIFGAWALYLLLSVLAEPRPRTNIRITAAGVLVAAAVVTKFAIAFIAPGLLVFVAALVLVGKPRAALLFVVVAALAGIVFYAPWAIVLQVNDGSPMFPLYNAIFRAPRFPAYNIQDTRFPVTSIGGLISLPVRLALGTSATSETPIRDVRWLMAFLGIGGGMGFTAARIIRGRARLNWRANLPALTLVAFWLVSFVVWAYVFGIQRYAIILEVLTLPVIAIGIAVMLPRLPGAASLMVLLVLVALVGATTRIADFGRRPMGWAPLFPTETIQPLTQYDAIVIGSDPLAYLSAVTRNAPGASDRIWLGAPFDGADRAIGMTKIAGKSIGVVFYTNARPSAVSVAADFGLQLTPQCQSFDNPLASRYMPTGVEVCAAIPSR